MSDEIMQEALSIVSPWVNTFGITPDEEYEIVSAIRRALLARDTAARKECAEIARESAAECDGQEGWLVGTEIAAAIEATITGGGNE